MLAMNSIDELVILARNLSDPLKARIYTYLSIGPKDLTSIAAALNKPATTIDYHLKQMKIDGMVKTMTFGKFVLYKTTYPIFVADSAIEEEAKEFINELSSAFSEILVNLASEKYKNVAMRLAERCAGGGYSSHRIREYLVSKAATQAIMELEPKGEEDSYAVDFAKAVQSALKTVQKQKIYSDLTERE